MDIEYFKKLLKLNRKERFFDEESISELCKDAKLNKEQLMHTALFLTLCLLEKIEEQEDEIKRLNKDKGL
jgi:beta-N-acetylglucosaminidase